MTATTSKDKSALEGILAKDLVYTHSTGLVEDKGQSCKPSPAVTRRMIR